MGAKNEALEYVIKWLESNGHSTNDRKEHNGDMDKCFACGVIDRCNAALEAKEAVATANNSDYAAALRAVIEYRKMGDPVQGVAMLHGWLEERLNSAKPNIA